MRIVTRRARTTLVSLFARTDRTARNPSEYISIDIYIFFIELVPLYFYGNRMFQT